MDTKYGFLTLALVAGLLALYVMLTPKGQALLALAKTPADTTPAPGV